MSIRSIRAALPTMLAVCGLLGTAAPVYAELGGAPMVTPSGAVAKTITPVARAASSTSASGTASVASTASAAASTASYTIKQTTLSGGTVVREYVAQDGKVFAIAWRGPRIPDLSTLLGTYFPQYKSALEAQRAQRAGRGPAAVDESGLVVYSVGHMGAFFGQAYLRNALPSGVSADQIQ